MYKRVLLVTPFYEGVGGVESSLKTLVKYLRKNKWVVDVINNPPLKDYERLEASPFKAFMFIGLPLILKAIPFIFKKKKYVLHGAGLIGGFVAMVLSKLTGNPYVVSTHALYKEIREFSYFEKKVLTNASYVLCLTQESEIEMKSYNINTVTYKTLVDWEKFCPEDRKKIYKGLFVARPIPKKGWEVVKQIKDIHCLSDVPNHKLPFFYQSSEYTVTAAQYPECFSRTILESLFCDTPVIASNKDVASHEIPHNVVTFVPPTVKDIKKTIRSHRRKYKGFYRNYAMNNYGPDNIKTFTDTYKLALEDSH